MAERSPVSAATATSGPGLAAPPGLAAAAGPVEAMVQARCLRSCRLIIKKRDKEGEKKTRKEKRTGTTREEVVFKDGGM